MRSALIVATFALSVLAAPVPELESRTPAPIQSAVERGLHRTESGAFVVTNGRSVEVDDEEELDARGYVRGPSKRQPGYVRGPSKREPSYVRGPSKRDPGYVRGSNKRDFEDDDEEQLETRGYVRGPSKRTDVEEDDEEELEAPGYVRGSNKREAEAEPGYVRGSNKREAEAEPGYVRGSNKREAEAEPGYVRGSNKRSTWASGIIEALKTRGFSSAALINARQPN